VCARSVPLLPTARLRDSPKRSTHSRHPSQRPYRSSRMHRQARRHWFQNQLAPPPHRVRPH
jgi:hypothetical protein